MTTAKASTRKSLVQRNLATKNQRFRTKSRVPPLPPKKFSSEKSKSPLSDQTLINLVLVVALPSAFLLFMRYSVVASEGYPTWEAVRNMLVRDGEIVITLPDGVKVVEARCDDPQGDLSIDGQVVTTKIGYSRCTIALYVEINGQAHTLQFNAQKLNNWNRMLFEPIHRSDPFSDFKKIENGVWKR